MTESNDRRSFGQIITFYSYKGGTGRSMALANIGYILAAMRHENPKRILMIDWDLEAPGLHYYFQKDLAASAGTGGNGERAHRDPLSAEPGLIEFLARIIHAGDGKGW